MNFTATSVAQPNLGAGVSTQTQSTTVTVQTGVITPSPTPTSTATPSSSPSPSPTPTGTASCPAVGATIGAGTQYDVYNSSSQSPSNGSATNALYPMYSGTLAPTATALADYSTDDGLGTHGGRTLSAISSFSATNTTASQVAAFLYQSPNGSYRIKKGTAYVDIWARPASGQTTDSVSLQAAANVYTPAGAYQSTVGSMSAAVTSTGCGDWQEFVLAIPISATFKPGNNYYIGAVIENVGSTPAQLAYDTTTYTATTTWPVG
jgi:hypothetical protein